MPSYCLIYHYGVDLFWPLTRKEKMFSLCVLCVSSEAGGEKKAYNFHA